MLELKIDMSIPRPSLNPRLAEAKRRRHPGNEHQGEEEQTMTTEAPPSGQETPRIGPDNVGSESDFQATGWGSNRL